MDNTCEICPLELSNHGNHEHVCSCPPCSEARRERIMYWKSKESGKRRLDLEASYGN